MIETATETETETVTESDGTIYVPPRSQASLATESFTKISELLSRPFHRNSTAEPRLTLSEWRALVNVQRSPGITAQEIVSKTGMSSMNVSRALASLRKNDRVRVQRDTQDSRRKLLWTTQAGDELAAELMPSANRHSQRVYSVLTHDELVFLNALLSRLAANAERVESEAGAGEGGDDE